MSVWGSGTLFKIAQNKIYNYIEFQISNFKIVQNNTYNFILDFKIAKNKIYNYIVFSNWSINLKNRFGYFSNIFRLIL